MKYIFQLEDGSFIQGDTIKDDDKQNVTDGYMSIVRWNESTKQYENLSIEDDVTETWTPLETEVL